MKPPPRVISTSPASQTRITRPSASKETVTASPDNPTDESPQWLTWAREIQALARTSLTFCHNEFNVERLQRLEAIAAEIVATHTDLPQEQALKNFQTQTGYATVKVDVRGAMIRDNRILLVQERRDQKWCMPGGWADVGERPADMVTREIKEESGFEAQPQKIIGIYDANRAGRPLEFYHAYKIIFLCDITGGHPQASNETMAVDFFDFDDLPPLSPNRTHQRHLDEIRAHIDDPNRPAFFE